MLAQALQIVKLILTAVFLRDDVVDVDVRLANFFAALGAGVPAVIRFVVREVLRLIEVGASCFKDYRAFGCVLHSLHRRKFPHFLRYMNFV